jgi:hypothetical protein
MKLICLAFSITFSMARNILFQNNNVLFYEENGKILFLHKNKTLNDFNPDFIVEDDELITLASPVNYEVRYSGVSDQFQEPWHLRRLVNENSSGRNKFKDISKCVVNNSIVNYIVDTGIDSQHFEFNGRARMGANFADDLDYDCNSHGTHVSGLIGSNTYGVCNSALLVGVKVLNCEGSGRISDVIKGLNWVYNQHVARKQKSVVNMSLGGGKSKSIDTVIREMLKEKNMFIIVASGNENSDTCNTSPGGIKETISVMASTSRDLKSYFSNWGQCSFIYSPGSDILSTIPDNKTAIYSGTSQASPIVAGVINRILRNNASITSQSELMNIINEKYSLKNKIKNNSKFTPNKLIHLI